MSSAHDVPSAATPPATKNSTIESSERERNEAGRAAVELRLEHAAAAHAADEHSADEHSADEHAAAEHAAAEHADIQRRHLASHARAPREPARPSHDRVERERGPIPLGAIALPSAAGEVEPLLGQRSWLEVIAMTSLPPLAMTWLAPDDPLLLGGHFPWFVLLPVLVGAQHGALAAAVSSALLAGTGALHQALGAATPAATLASFAGGCFATGVIAGNFRDRVQARLSRLGREARDGAERLSRLARAHAVVKLSHQRLEERLAAHGWSLVSAFEDARRALAGQSTLAGVGEVVLRVLSNHALVQSATLLTLARDGARPVFEARASVGNPIGIEPEKNALVQRALDTGRLVALDAESADGGEHDVLAVAPLVTASGRLLGLVTIHELPFMAFQAENLKGLAALTALLADLLEDHFIEAHTEDALLLSLVPEHAPGDSPSSETRLIGDDRAADDRATEEWLEDELAANELPDEIGPDGEFVGSRTGTHRRRGVAQSA